MTGHETIVLRMVTPRGVSLVQALTFKQPEGFYEADVTSLEVQCLLPGVPRLTNASHARSAHVSPRSSQTTVEEVAQCYRPLISARMADSLMLETELWHKRIAPGT